jgi:integrase
MELFKRPETDIWQAYCHFFDGTKRRRVPKSTGIRDDGTIKSRQSAEAVAREIERSLAIRSGNPAKPSATVGKALKKLIEKAELAGLGEHAVRAITDRGLRLDEGLNLDTKLAEITEQQLFDYAVQARKGSTDHKPRAAYTVSKEFEMLERAYKVVGMAPPPFPDLGDVSHKPQRVLELDEQRALLLAIPAKRKLLLQAYVQLGVRASEPWKITEYDWAERYVFVNGTKTKNSKRWVPIPAELYELMYARRGEDKMFPHVAKSNFDALLKHTAKRAGLDDDISCNDLRGTFATFMARAGVPILILAKIMGNSVKMLESVYAQVAARGDHLRDAAAKLPRLAATGAATVRQNPREQRETRQGGSGGSNRND